MPSYEDERVARWDNSALDDRIYNVGMAQPEADPEDDGRQDSKDDKKDAPPEPGS